MIAEQPSSLRDYVERMFTFDTQDSQQVRKAMDYQFEPMTRKLFYRGLNFEVILNSGRYAYVQESLSKLSQASGPQPRSQSISTTESTAVPAFNTATKRSVCRHMAPPGCTVCEFDNLETDPLLVKQVRLNGVDYGLLVNKRPWGFNHLMLVTLEAKPQCVTTDDLAASFELIQELGPGYEGIFSGVLAGASVYHFHLHVRRGAAIIWNNLDSRKLLPTQFYETQHVRAKSLEGWPACLFLFEGTDPHELAEVVCRMVQMLTAGENDFPYNLGFRQASSGIQLLLIPRCGLEKPSLLNRYPDSWGRFAFVEMAGSVFLLTPEGFRATLRSGAQVHGSIAQMSIRPDQVATLIREFLA